MKIAHRRAVYFRDWNWRTLPVWDGLIDICSGGSPLFPGHCHTELLFDNGHSFTSTTRIDPATSILQANDHNGPVIRRIEFKPGEWDFTELNLTDSQKLQLYRSCVELIADTAKEGGQYDFSGVARFVLPWIKEHKKDWFCTESCVDRLQQIGLFTGLKPSATSPNKFFKLCNEKLGNNQSWYC